MLDDRFLCRLADYTAVQECTLSQAPCFAHLCQAGNTLITGRSEKHKHSVKLSAFALTPLFDIDKLHFVAALMCPSI